MTTLLSAPRRSGRRAVAPIALGTAAVLGGCIGFAGAGAATVAAQASTPAPVVTAISPPSGPAGGGTPVTITGSGFDATPGATTVTFGGIAASVATCSTTTCVAISPPGLGPQTVIVTVAGQSSSGSAASTFVDRPPVPLAMAPTNGPTSGGTRVTISGVNFDTVPGTTLVNFGSTPATSVTCPTTTTCMATSPPGAGAAFVAVVEDGFSIPPTSAVSFTYLTPPVGQISCGLTVTQSITLTQDLGPCPGNGLVVRASGITVDLAGHRIFGTAGAGDNRVGIELSGTTGDTVTGDATPKSTRTGEVEGFASGISIDGGGHNAITRLDVHDNVGLTSVTGNRGDGIVIGSVAASSHNVISNSVISHNGVFDGVGVFGAQSKGNQILNSQITDNNVAGVFADGSPAHVDEGVNLGFGIEGSNATTISGDTISRSGLNGIDACTPDGGGPCLSVENVITGNLIEANGTPGIVSSGINISIFVDGPNPFVASTDTISGNQVLNNLGVGIFVNNPGNSITNNVALGNSADPTTLRFGARYDVYDGTANCDHNIWRGNTYDVNEAFPACAGKNGTAV